MLYANFVAASVAAAGMMLNAGSSVADAIGEQAVGRRPLRLDAPLSAADIEALEQLSSALRAHSIRGHGLTGPDDVIAAHARAAAALASGRTRETLLSLAESAQSSVLAFLVDYHLAAGAWEEGGLRMSSPGLPQR